VWGSARALAKGVRYLLGRLGRPRWRGESLSLLGAVGAAEVALLQLASLEAAEGELERGNIGAEDPDHGR
jgi:hypothetical protein